MRLLSFPNIIRTLYTFSNATARTFPSLQQKTVPPFTRGTILRSMPTIPFFGSLFSSSSSKDMKNYPVQKSDAEWRAVLSPGKSFDFRSIHDEVHA